MLFNSMTFLWIFLPVLILVYFLAKRKYRNYILLIFSLIFYAWGEPKYILLMLASIIVNYVMGLLIDRAKKKAGNKSKWKTRALLIVDILFNVGLLAHFKYANFFFDNINNMFGQNINIGNIALPIGISFYTFQIMSYIIDLYRGEIKVQKSLVKLALYISFFPQLIAGPIVKYRDIDNAIDARRETPEKFAYGIKRFVRGLAKKVLIADVLAAVADMFFGGGISGLTQPVAWLGALSYSLQIFFDFSGYSDMAIGLGSMFGFKFMENFNLPYISSSITEFWRRWHISLSTWFKEYIYIPLGGNRKGKIRTFINLWVVFLVTGIWHGAAWNFVIWGIFHGFFIFIERLGFKKLLDKTKILGHLYTLLVVLNGWVIFRAPSLKYGINYLKVMYLGNNSVALPTQLYTVVNNKFVAVLIIAILLSGILQVAWGKIEKGFTKKMKQHRKLNGLIEGWLKPATLFVLLLLCIMAIISNTYSSFIYFRF